MKCSIKGCDKSGKIYPEKILCQYHSLLPSERFNNNELDVVDLMGKGEGFRLIKGFNSGYFDEKRS